MSTYICPYCFPRICAGPDECPFHPERWKKAQPAMSRDLAAFDLTGWPQSATPVITRTMVLGLFPANRFKPL